MKIRRGRFGPPLLLKMLLTCAAAHGQAIPSSIAGTWHIVKVLPTTNPACWDADRARSLIGTTLKYTPGKLTWHGGDIPISEALTRTLSLRKFQDEYKIDLASLGIRAASVQEIDLQHEDADVTGATTEVPGDTVLLAGPGRIVVSACGVYYSAVRLDREAQGSR